MKTKLSSFLGFMLVTAGILTLCSSPLFAQLSPTPLDTMPTTNGSVLTIYPDGAGGAYIGGSFTELTLAPVHGGGTVTCNSIARINADGSLDETWNPDANGTVSSLIVNWTTVLAGGYFTTIGGASRNYIAGLDGFGTAGNAISFNPDADGSVRALAVNWTTGTIYAGGTFTNIGGASRNHIAALDSSGNATSWNPNPNDDYIYALGVSGGVVYAGGTFTIIGGESRQHIAALDAAGNATSWNPNANDYVYTIALNGGVIYAGGSFSTIGGASREHIAALDASGNATAWNPDADNAVRTLVINGGVVYAGGYFTNIGGAFRNKLAALDVAGNANAWNPNADATAYALALSGGRLYAGGDFTTVGGKSRNRFAVFAPNVAPSAVNDSYTTTEETPLIISSASGGLLDNDSDGNKDPLTVVKLTDPSYGSLTLWPDGEFTYTPDPDYSGTDSFTYKLNDTITDSNAATVTITVIEVTDPPVITGQNPMTIPEDTPLTIAAGHLVIEDPDSSSFTLTTSDGSNYTRSGNTVTPAANFNGTLTVPVKVNDGATDSNTFNLSITVTPVDDPPIITDQTPLSTPEDTPLTIALGHLTISDPDSSSFTLMVYDGSSYTRTDSTVTPAANFSGTLTVPVKINDGNTSSATFNLSIDVAAINDPPDFTASDPPEVPEDAGRQTLSGWASFDPGPGESDQTATYFVSNISQSELFAALPGVDTDGTLSYTPAENAFGDSAFDVKVRDSGGGSDTSATQTFTITITSVNDPAVFTSEAVTDAIQDIPYTYDITASDVENDTLFISTETIPAWLGLTDKGDGTASLSGTPGNSEVGEYDITLKLEDAEDVTTQSFTVTVENVNDAPLLDNSSDMTLNPINEDAEEAGNIGTPVSEIIASSAVSDPISDIDIEAAEGIAVIAVNKANGIWQYDPGGDMFLDFPPDIADYNAVLLNESSKIRFLPDADYNGTADIFFRAWDQSDGSNGDTGTDATANGGYTAFSTEIGSAVITVNPVNDTPRFDDEADPTFLTATEDRAYTHIVSTSDVDAGDTRFFTALTPLPAWLELADNDDGSATLTGIPVNEDVGDYSFELQIRDATGADDTQAFVITVENVNDEPFFTGEPIISATEDVPYTCPVSTEDVDVGDTRAVTAPILPTWLILTQHGDGTARLSGTPVNDDVGTHSVTLKVEDAANASVLRSFFIKVVNTNDEPKFTSDELTEATEDFSYSYTITTSDPDALDNRSITAPTLPSWLRLTDEGNGMAILSGTPENEHVGEHRVELKVEDSVGTSDTQSFLISVRNVNDQPLFTSTPDTYVVEDYPYVCHIATRDVDLGDTRVITAPTLPEWLSLTDKGNGMADLRGTPSNKDVGEHEVRLRVGDADSAEDFQAFTIIVANLNDAPHLDNSGEMAFDPIDEDVADGHNIGMTIASLLSADKADDPISDADADAEEGIAVISVANIRGIWQYDKDRNGIFTNFPDGIAEENAVLLNDSAVMRFVPDPDFSGSSHMAFRAWDRTTGNNGEIGADTTANGGTTAFSTNAQEAEIVIRPVNDTPLFIDAELPGIAEDTAYIYKVRTEDADTEDTRTISANTLPSWLTLADEGDGTAMLVGTPGDGDVGDHILELEVTDAAGESEIRFFAILVTNIDDTPVFTSTAITDATQDVPYTYAITAADPDAGDSLVITATTLPFWLSLTDNGDGKAVLTGTPGNLDTGDHQTELLVTDATGSASTQSFTISVANVNDMPVLTSDPAPHATEGEIYTYTMTAVDFDTGDALVITSLTLPSWLILEDRGDGTAILTGTPGKGDAGDHIVELRVEDAAGASDIRSFSISVTDTNEVPVITDQHPLSVTENTPLTIRLYDLEVEDPDNAFPNDFKLTIHDGDNYAIEENTVTPVPNFTGLLTIPVSVNDGSNDSDVFLLSVAVLPGNSTRTVSGTIFGPRADTKIWVNVLSLSTGKNEIRSLAGRTGGITDYRITGLEPAADYHVEVRADGYHYQIYKNQENLEDAEVINLLYNDASDIDFTLIPFQAMISGKVIFPEGASPGQTARIEAYSASENESGEALAVFSGDSLEVSYEITNLIASDDYIVSVWSDQYKNRYHDGSETGVALEKDAKPVNTEAPDVRNVIFRLEEGETLSGTIIGDDMEDIWVEAWNSSGLAKGVSVSVDGTFVIRGLDPGPVTLVAWKPEIAPFFHSSEGTVRDASLATPVDVQDGSSEDIQIVIYEGESISGSVQDESGEPLSGIWVSARSEAEQAGHGAFTSEDGTYVIEGLPRSEDYEVSASPKPYMPSEVAEGIFSGSIADFSLNPDEGEKIKMVVKDENGIHIPNVGIEIWSDEQNFYGWGEMPSGSGKLHIPSIYEITGIPLGDSYVIQARPPSDSSYALFKEKNISVHEGAVLDIIPEPGSEIIGKVEAEEQVRDVRVIVASEEKNFRAEALTDGNSFYRISNVPDASDYVITTRSEFHTSEEKALAFGETDDEIILTLESAGEIFGEVKDGMSGEAIPGAFMSARSESMGASANYSGMAVSGEQGRYAIKGLRKEYDDGTLVSDYVVTADADAYPSDYELAKRAGDEVSFFLDIGESISGQVSNFSSHEHEAFVLDIFEEHGDFIKTVPVEADGSFYVPGLRPDGQYQLKFIAFVGDAESLVQWAGERDVGFDPPAPYVEKNPDEAKAYNAGANIFFRFGENSESRNARKRGNSRSEERSSLRLRSSASGTFSNQSEITVIWESLSESPDERYYYLFNRESDFRITKRSAPRNRPRNVTRATSRKLAGDDISYHFHVAPVDRRGRIGSTASLGFRIDTVPPSNAMATAQRFTSERAVSLTLGATGASEMLISNSNYGMGGKWEKWNRIRSWRLTEGEGPKRVYVQFRDRAGNTANALALTEMVAAMPDQYVIAATAGKNGAIIPSGEVAVYSGEDVRFTLAPDSGYEVDRVLANGQPVTPEGNTYILRDVTADGSVSVTFRPESLVTHIITATAGPGGSITPAGEILVADGEGISFFVFPDAGYEIDAVFLDGKKVRLREENRFDFINADRDYALSVTFEIASP